MQTFPFFHNLQLIIFFSRKLQFLWLIDYKTSDDFVITRKITDHYLFYDWEKYFIAIGWEETNLM